MYSSATAQSTERLSASALEAFRSVTRSYALFHILFFCVGCAELLAFILFFSTLTQSTLFAFTLAGLLFTSFTYFVLLFYFQAKKPQQLIEVKDAFIEQCKAVLPREGAHAALAQCLYQLLADLKGEEYTCYPVPETFKTFSLLARKFSVFAHWKDVHHFKELLLHAIIRAYIACVQVQPTDIHVHTQLATAFLALARLYIDPRKTESDVEHLWVSPEYNGTAMGDKFKKAAQRAVEELCILGHFSPKDPWVHAQLAGIYADLGETEKEISAYETLLKLTPEHPDVLFRLGALYFSQGQSAQALCLYEKLQQLSPPKAEELLSYYDFS